MYYVKKYWLLWIGWWSSGWKHCYYNRRVVVLRDGGAEVGGLIVEDDPKGRTLILCDDGLLQWGGFYRIVK